MTDDYPGKGDPWADFLHHRARAIVMFVKHEKKTYAEVASILSMDATQVRLIYQGTQQTEG